MYDWIFDAIVWVVRLLVYNVVGTVIEKLFIGRAGQCYGCSPWAITLRQEGFLTIILPSPCLLQ
ncbi:hypothetical protein OX462_13755 [Janthinobacterium sp. SUN098]|uniref:hypothetical protein n=1 Tax=unclassified Janthinobacterium TaxID=2610881 RepID=UPI000874E5FE|nr:hypothetical protein [Janthinobacterium sp. HH107]